MPGAAMVIREITTCVMPTAAALWGQRRAVRGHLPSVHGLHYTGEGGVWPSLSRYRDGWTHQEPSVLTQPAHLK